jgi:hypothetical protein
VDRHGVPDQACFIYAHSLLLLQLPRALQLPLQSDSRQLDMAALAAAVPSRLLVALLAAAYTATNCNVKCVLLLFH